MEQSSKTLYVGLDVHTMTGRSIVGLRAPYNHHAFDHHPAGHVPTSRLHRPHTLVQRGRRPHVHPPLRSVGSLTGHHKSLSHCIPAMTLDVERCISAVEYGASASVVLAPRQPPAPRAAAPLEPEAQPRRPRAVDSGARQL